MVIKWVREHIQIVTVLAIAILFILVTALAVVLTLPKNKENNKESTTQNQTVSFPDVSIPDEVFTELECEHTLNDYEDKYIENNEELIYSYALYPVISVDKDETAEVINNVIYQFVTSKSTIKEHERILAQEKYNRASMNAEGFIQFEFMLKTESITVKEKFLSILFSYTRTVSLSEPSYEFFALNFDLTNGNETDFSDIVALTEEDAVNYISTIISQDISINPNIYYPNARDELDYCIDLNSFYLSDKGAVLFFNPETLTPSVYGIRSFLIPYDKIGY